MRAFWQWMAGRKTYLLAGVVILVALGLVFLGRMTPTIAAAISTFAVAGFGVTFRSALARHQAEELALLREVLAAGIAFHGHDLTKLTDEGFKAAWDGCALAHEVMNEGAR